MVFVESLRCAGAWSGTFVGALAARSRRSRLLRSRPPGVGAARPYPRTPTRGKLSLQAVFFARCARPAALRAGFFVLAHGATRPCARLLRAPAAAVRCAYGPPRVGAARPYPRTPTRGKLSLQAVFCARCARVCASRRCFFVLAHAATRPLVLHPASSYHARMFFRRCVSRSQNCRAASALSPRRLM